MQNTEIGDAFLIKTPPNGKHLYIIIAIISENKYLSVNTTTSKTKIDQKQDCVISPGEGVPDYISCQSTITYRYAREFSNKEIEKLINRGECEYKGKFSEEYVYEILLKGISSKRLKNKYKNILKEILKSYQLRNYEYTKLG